MTRLIEVSGVQELAQNVGIEHLKLFQAEVTQMSDLAMKILVKQFRMKLGLKDGHAMAKRVLLEIKKAAALGEIPSCPASRHVLETPRLTMDEFRRLVSRFEPIERCLICFALDTGMNLLDASLVRHDKVKALLNINRGKWHEEVAVILQQTPRHLRCPYVFWESNEQGEPGPIMDIHSRFRERVGISWPTFELLVKDMIMIDRQKDAREVVELLKS